MTLYRIGRAEHHIPDCWDDLPAMVDLVLGELRREGFDVIDLDDTPGLVLKLLQQIAADRSAA